jgi:hypothetical protein
VIRSELARIRIDWKQQLVVNEPRGRESQSSRRRDLSAYPTVERKKKLERSFEAWTTVPGTVGL